MNRDNSLQIEGAVALKSLRLAQDGDFRRGHLDIYLIEQDQAGNVLLQANNRMDLKLTAQQYERYLQTGIMFRQFVQLKPQTTFLRVLVQDPSSAELGSLIIPVSQLK